MRSFHAKVASGFPELLSAATICFTLSKGMGNSAPPWVRVSLKSSPSSETNATFAEGSFCGKSSIRRSNHSRTLTTPRIALDVGSRSGTLYATASPLLPTSAGEKSHWCWNSSDAAVEESRRQLVTTSRDEKLFSNRLATPCSG